VRAYRRLDPEHSAGQLADSYSAALTMDVGTLELKARWKRPANAVIAQ
jgi:hypothetical protein